MSSSSFLHYIQLINWPLDVYFSWVDGHLHQIYTRFHLRSSSNISVEFSNFDYHILSFFCQVFMADLLTACITCMISPPSLMINLKMSLHYRLAVMSSIMTIRTIPTCCQSRPFIWVKPTSSVRKHQFFSNLLMLKMVKKFSDDLQGFWQWV